MGNWQFSQFSLRSVNVVVWEGWDSVQQLVGGPLTLDSEGSWNLTLKYLIFWINICIFKDNSYNHKLLNMQHRYSKTSSR